MSQNHQVMVEFCATKITYMVMAWLNSHKYPLTGRIYPKL